MLTGKTNSYDLFIEIMEMIPVGEVEDSYLERAQALWMTLTLNEIIQLAEATEEQREALVTGQITATLDGWVYYIPSSPDPQPTTFGIKTFMEKANQL